MMKAVKKDFIGISNSVLALIIISLDMVQPLSVMHGMIYTACVEVVVKAIIFQTINVIVRVVIGIKVLD
jgi:hypothetical protein